MNIIIGAGLTGLSAAYHLNSDDYIIFEADEKACGRCNSFYLDGFTFDATGHVLHFRHDYTLNLARELLKDNLHRLQRKSSIYFDGALVPYPFQMNLFRLPHQAKMECLMGAIEATYERNGHDTHNFAEWILASLGEGIARHFMFPYNEKIWTIHPREMTTSWLSGFVPQPDLRAVLEGAIRDRGDNPVGYNAEFWYPLRGGIEAYLEAFLPFVDDLRLGIAVESIDIHRRSVLAGGQRYPYTNLISTAPIVDLVKMIEQAPGAIVTAAQKLRTNSVYSILLGVGRPDISDQHWVYVPHKDSIFYRIGFPSNLSPYMCPEGSSSMCVEVAYQGSLDMPEQILVEQTISNLTAMGFLRPEDEILVKKAVRTSPAYVIYDYARDTNVEMILNYLRAHRIFSTGRYGNWEYSAMEDAVLAGKKMAETINYGGLETAIGDFCPAIRPIDMVLYRSAEVSCEYEQA